MPSPIPAVHVEAIGLAWIFRCRSAGTAIAPLTDPLVARTARVLRAGCCYAVERVAGHEFRQSLQCEPGVAQGRLQLRRARQRRPSTTPRPASIGCASVARRRIARSCAPCSRRMTAAAPSCARSAPPRRWRRSRSSSRSAPRWRPSRRPGAREEGPQGRVHPDHLRHAHHHGAPDGLLHQARPERGGGEDRRLGRDPRQDAQQGIRRRAHALADAARDHAGRRLQSDPLHDAGGREHQRPGHHAHRQAQGQARSQDLEGLQVRGALRLLDAQLPACATTWPSTASTPTPTSRSAPSRRRRWWPTCAPTTSTASSAPIPSTSAPSTTASASSTCCRRRSGKGIPAAPSRRPRSSSPPTPNTYAALLKAIIDATAFAAKPENRKQIAEAIAPANYLNQPVTVLEQILTGTYRRRPRQREDRCPSASISIRSPGSRSRCGS